MSDLFGHDDLTPEEVRQLLRAMPRANAPDDLEHQLLTRIAILRRAGSVTVASSRPRPDVLRGLLAAVTAGFLFALGWLLFSDGQQVSAPSAPERVIARPAAPVPGTPNVVAPVPQSANAEQPAVEPERNEPVVTGELPASRAAARVRSLPIDRAPVTVETVDSPTTPVVETRPVTSTPATAAPPPVEPSLTGGHTDTAPGP